MYSSPQQMMPMRPNRPMPQQFQQIHPQHPFGVPRPPPPQAQYDPYFDQQAQQQRPLRQSSPPRSLSPNRRPPMMQQQHPMSMQPIYPQTNYPPISAPPHQGPYPHHPPPHPHLQHQQQQQPMAPPYMASSSPDRGFVQMENGHAQPHFPSFHAHQPSHSQYYPQQEYVNTNYNNGTQVELVDMSQKDYYNNNNNNGNNGYLPKEAVANSNGQWGWSDPKASPPQQPANQPPPLVHAPSKLPEDAIEVHSVAEVAIPEDQRVDLSFENIVYSVPDKKQPNGKKTILQGVSGVAKAGEMIAIMGPSGSGKTTLLDFLANRMKSGTRSGEILVNKQKLTEEQFARIAKYIMQEDRLLGTMTVKETFDFAADIKLPRDGGDFEAKKQRITSRVIDAFGLTDQLNTKIGTVFQRGLTSGQQRRVSIGIEILDQPRIIFADEPTSGLDSASAFAVVETLKELAKSGMCVICTIHQPASEVFAMFDRVMLLSRGKVIYSGLNSGVLDYFAAQGHVCPPFTNPADYMMRLINTDFPGHADIQMLAESWDNNPNKNELFKAIRTSKVTQSTNYNLGFLQQFLYVFKRQNIDNVRNPGVFWIRLLMYLMLSFMIGTSFIDIGDDQRSITDRISLIFYINAFLVFMSIAVVPTFIQDRLVFTRERSNGWYSPAAYVLSGALSSIPGLVIISLLCTALIYPVVNLNDISGRGGVFILTLFLSLYCAESLVVFLSSLTGHYIIAMALGAGVYGYFMIAQGALVIKPNIPKWLLYIDHYVAFHSYAFQVFLRNEFAGDGGPRLFCQKAPSSECPLFKNGDEVLAYFGFEDSVVWEGLIIIFAMAIFYRICFAAIVQKYHTGKR